MDFAPESSLAELGTRNARQLGKNFWGWYTLKASDVKLVGCFVKASPLSDNPWHADIVIPVDPEAEDGKDAITEYARDLAYHSGFRAWGDWTEN